MTRTSKSVVIVATIAFGAFLPGEAYCQNENQPRSSGQLEERFTKPGVVTENKLRVDVEPGVVRYGKANRFAVLGDCQSFDSSPDGHTIACATSAIKFFDLTGNRVSSEMGTRGRSYQNVVYSADGLQLFATTIGPGGRSVLQVFDAIVGEPRHTIGVAIEADESVRHHIQNFVVSPDANFVALNFQSSIQVRRVETGELIFHLKDQGYLTSLAISPDESELIVPIQGKIRVFDLETGDEKNKSESALVGQPANFVSVNLSRNLVAISGPAGVSLFDYATGKKTGTIRIASNMNPQALDLSDDGSRLAICSYQQTKSGFDQVIVVADVDRKKVIGKYNTGANGITRQRFSIDGKHLFVSGFGVYGIRDIRLDKSKDEIDASYPQDPAQAAILPADSDSFCTSTRTRLTWFDVATGEVTRTVNRSNVRAMKTSEDGTEFVLLSRGRSQQMERFSYEKGRPIKKFSTSHTAKKKFVDQVGSWWLGSNRNTNRFTQSYHLDVAYSANGDELSYLNGEIEYSWSTDPDTGNTTSRQTGGFQVGTIDNESGKRLFRKGYSSKQIGMPQRQALQMIQVGAVHPQGEEFAIARTGDVLVIDSKNGEIRHEHVSDTPVKVTVTDPKTGSLTMVPMSSTLQYSPDGRFLAAVRRSKGIMVWDTKSGKEVFRLPGSSAVRFLAFSFDGSRMVWCNAFRESNVRVVDTRNWKEVIPGRKTPVNRSAVALSSDGKRLFIGLNDSRMEVWDLDVIAHSGDKNLGEENSDDAKLEGRRGGPKAAGLSKFER